MISISIKAYGTISSDQAILMIDLQAPAMDTCFDLLAK